MTITFHHERIHRTSAVLDRLRDAAITICGAGALGANVAENLARSGAVRLRVVDRDRVEERNLSTQPYLRADVGSFKAKILANSLFRAVGASIDARCGTLTASNAMKLLAGSDLVIDTFDNSVSRAAVAEACDARAIPCLHAGLAGDFSEVIWNDGYRVPSAAHDDVCDYPLARTLAVLTAALAAELAIGFVADGRQRSLTFTLRDLTIAPFE